MKIANCQPLLFIASIAFAGVVAAQEVQTPVPVNVEGLPMHVRARILDKAQHGQTALIQYLQRTQTVHQLRPESIIRMELQPVVVIPGHAKRDMTARK